MIPILVFLLTVSAFGVIVYVYLRREQDKIITRDKDEKYSYNVFQTLKHPPLPLQVFYIVTSIHFLIIVLIYFIFGLRGYGIFVITILMAPGIILGFFIEPLLRNLELSLTFDSFLPFLWLLVSSITYGIMGGFLASKKINLQLTSIVLVCLFIIFGFYWGMMVLFSALG
jgi:hypothetical protein